MRAAGPPGRVVILNGAPRSGKTSIARALQATSAEPWVNLGVDASMTMTPARLLPGIGLRPGGERPDLEPIVEVLYLALYDAVGAHARRGVNVVVDVGHHDGYSRPLHLLPRVAAGLVDLPALLVGVRCPLDEIMRRRDASAAAGSRTYLSSGDSGAVPDPVARWQRAVHDPGIYDLEVDTARSSPEDCADAIRHRLTTGPPATAIGELARRAPPEG